MSILEFAGFHIYALEVSFSLHKRIDSTCGV